MKIEVLGSNCKRCKSLEEIVRKVVSNNNIEAEIEKITDLQIIMNYGVMNIPALVVDGIVKSTGKVPKAKQILGFIKG
ncbi:MAG: thioredoxin family protein [Candidatus Tenebribacter davisii]|jgi:small redox-active disulfide protein 2|nr:thioredoxin family protein [Candidatus Tenebribacter davisii]